MVSLLGHEPRQFLYQVTAAGIKALSEKFGGSTIPFLRYYGIKSGIAALAAFRRKLLQRYGTGRFGL